MPKYLDGSGVQVLWRELESALVTDISEVAGSAAEAKELAEQAQQSADAAQSSADSAQQSADAASQSASSAQQSADTALANANSAIASAQTANTAANSALVQLAVVEDVAGTLDWIQKNGTYSVTTDTTVQPGTVYFEYDSTTQDYIPISSPDPTANPHDEGWYILEITEAQGDFIMSHLAVTGQGLWVLPNGINSGQVTQIYILTTDTTVDSSKVYYTYNSSTGLYTIVSNPDPSANPQALGWYVLEDIDDARARESDNYKILLSNQGMNVYDDTGHIVSSFGESITFDSTRPQYIGGEQAYILFNPTNQTLTIGGDKVVFGSQSLSDLLDEINDATSAVADMQEKIDSGELDAITVRIDSSAGTVFLNKQISTTLTCTVIRGNGTDITNQVTRFTWIKKNADGTTDTSWSRPLAGNIITISDADVASKAIFICEVEF